MSEGEEKPRRRKTRGGKAVSEPEPPVDPEDVARSDQKEAHSKNEISSKKLLMTLNLHHRHGYGEYNKKPES